MRSLIRAAFVAISVAFAVPALPALAQNPPAARTWAVVDIKDLPDKVVASQKKVFASSKITKAERSGTGAAMVYRLTMSGKVKEATFTAAGELVQ